MPFLKQGNGGDLLVQRRWLTGYCWLVSVSLLDFGDGLALMFAGSVPTKSEPVVLLWSVKP